MRLPLCSDFKLKLREVVKIFRLGLKISVLYKTNNKQKLDFCIRTVSVPQKGICVSVQQVGPEYKL